VHRGEKKKGGEGGPVWGGKVRELSCRDEGDNTKFFRTMKSVSTAKQKGRVPLTLAGEMDLSIFRDGRIEPHHLFSNNGVVRLTEFSPHKHRGPERRLVVRSSEWKGEKN